MSMEMYRESASYIDDATEWAADNPVEFIGMLPSDLVADYFAGTSAEDDAQAEWAADQIDAAHASLAEDREGR